MLRMIIIFMVVLLKTACEFVAVDLIESAQNLETENLLSLLALDGVRIFTKDKILSSATTATSFWLLEGSNGQSMKFCWVWIGWRRSLAKTSSIIGSARKSTILVFFFYADLYIFLDLWVWFPRGFNVDCFGIFCAKIDFEWVSQLGLSWFGEHEEWSSCSRLEVSGFDIFLGWFSHVGLGLMIFSCSRGFGRG